MRAVNVAELKNRLSYYLRLVRRGQSLLVRDRERVIARIEPAGAAAAPADGEAARIADLEARGIIRRGRGPVPAKLLARRPSVDADVVGALLREREDGR